MRAPSRDFGKQGIPGTEVCVSYMIPSPAAVSIDTLAGSNVLARVQLLDENGEKYIVAGERGVSTPWNRDALESRHTSGR